jgi:predicted GIY-YIG superfamily endonuclease
MSDTTHTVYRCYDSEGRLLYIGCTQDLDARMAVHECDGKNPASVELMRRIDLLEYEEFPDRASGLKAEREAIAAEAPLLNTHHNLGRGMKNLPPVPPRRLLTDEQRAEFNAIMQNFGGAA